LNEDLLTSQGGICCRLCNERKLHKHL